MVVSCRSIAQAAWMSRPLRLEELLDGDEPDEADPLADRLIAHSRRDRLMNSPERLGRVAVRLTGVALLGAVIPPLFVVLPPLFAPVGFAMGIRSCLLARRADSQLPPISKQILRALFSKRSSLLEPRGGDRDWQGVYSIIVSGFLMFLWLIGLAITIAAYNRPW